MRFILYLLLSLLSIGCSRKLFHPQWLTESAPSSYAVRFETTKGKFDIAVNRGWSPLAADRFYQLVQHRYYDKAVFYRVVPNFVAQFGSSDSALAEKWNKHIIPDEPVLRSNTKGRISFARSGRDSRGSEMFINLRDNQRLDTIHYSDVTGFPPFGEVINGMDVVMSLYSGYGDKVFGSLDTLYKNRRLFLKSYPKLDIIRKARIIPTPNTTDGNLSSEASEIIQIKDSGSVFSNPPFKNCHAATIVETSPDTLLYAWFGGDHEGAKNVAIWGCYRYATQPDQWGDPFLLATGQDSSGNAQPCWNPVLFKTSQGTLFLDYKVGPNPRQWWAERKISLDDGKSWSASSRLPRGFLGPIRNKPIQLTDGNILYPSSTESLDEKTWKIHLERSDAAGNNWQHIAIDCDTFGVIQPTILQHGNDTLQLLCRSRQNKIVETWSYDNGMTWSKLAALNLPNPNSGVDAVSLKRDLHLLVYNPLLAGKDWWLGRSVLKVAISADGRSWSDVATLEDHHSGEYSYPAVIVDSRNNIRIAYTDNRTNIKFVDLIRGSKKETGDKMMSKQFYDFSATDIRGREVSMDAYKGKTVIVVNTASKCGLTPQYEGLEDLYKRYKDKGLVILGFPCNQFGNQESGTEEAIEEFCQVNYGVSFPMFSKVDVNGDSAHPLFQFLKTRLGSIFGRKIKWNFTKFLVDKNGIPVKRFSPVTTPEKMERHIKKLLMI